MFIQIGNSNVIRTESIITIIDYHLFSSTANMQKTMNAKEAQKKIIKIKQTPKSVVITSDLIYYSSLSIWTLQKRSGFDSMIKGSEQIKMKI